MKNILLLMAFVLPLQVFANTTEVNDAWLSKSSFDGKSFKYELTAYDTQEPVDIKAVADCEYSIFQDRMMLSAIRLSVSLKASFDKPGQKAKKNGELDVAAQVSRCRAKLPAGSILNGPVQIKLPHVSITQ